MRGMIKKWTIRYRDDALEKLEKAITAHPDLKSMIIQRLQALEDFPPLRWFELRQQNGSDLFTSDNQMIHISGEADSQNQTVWINKVTVDRKMRKKD